MSIVFATPSSISTRPMWGCLAIAQWNVISDLPRGGYRRYFLCASEWATLYHRYPTSFWKWLIAEEGTYRGHIPWTFKNRTTDKQPYATRADAYHLLQQMLSGVSFTYFTTTAVSTTP
jgi:hypothetical protein